MFTVSFKPWIALLASGGMALGFPFLATPAHAAGCANGLLISVIANAGAGGYQCTLGGLTYTFSSDITELNTPTTPAPAVNFQDTGNTQVISFVNLNYIGNVAFNYTVDSPNDDILPYDLTTGVLQQYTQSPAGAPPATKSTVKVSKLLPSLAPTTVVFEPNFSPYGLGDPDVDVATLTSITNTIRKTPGPLPIVGAGAALALSRKLRHRIKMSS